MEHLVTRSWKQAMWRGWRGKCPACGVGSLFSSFTTVNDTCAHCSQPLHHHRADDAPPYFTIFIVGHIVVPLVFVVERIWEPSYWIHLVLWLPLVLVLTFILMPAVKGSIIGLQWALGMHGFAIESSANNPRP
jgi:uncharacterized protein (DUF983 family)